MAKQLNVNLAFTADTGQAKAQIQDLQNQLTHLTTSVGAGQHLGLTRELNEAAGKVAELKGLLASATTSTGKLDLGLFNEGLKKGKTSINDYAKALNALGPEGSRAFSQLAQAITTAEIPMRRANGLLSEMWTTMKNTARWQLTSSVLHGFIGGMQQALGYAKDLNKTLTDIRIVAPEKTMQDMAKFADLANKQAKELSSTTLDYAKGALIYYQQGLDDIATRERTDVTTKMANVTGDSVDEVSSYMTSIWNNFNKAGDESAEHFADILTKLGAETAASTTEITTALEKYTGVANTIGLSYESATAAATTLIDRLREQPEVAGTALKTIFARLEGLKLEGSTDEGGLTTDLNKYSNALHQIGVEIKDANGEIRAADNILMDIGKKWNSGELTQDVKIATAETVAGIRQWQQFAALMDNFEYFEKYKDMAATGSEGALQEQQDIYAESWEAAANRVKSSIQTIYMQLLDDKFFIKMLNTIANITDGFSKMIDAIGGLKSVLPLIGTLMISAFGDKMSKSIQTMTYNMHLFSKAGKEEVLKLREQANQALLNQSFGNGYAGKAQRQTYQDQYTIQEEILAKQEHLNELEIKQAQFIADKVAQRGEEIRLLGQQIDEEERIQKIEAARAGKYGDGTNNRQVQELYKETQTLGNNSGFITGIAENLGTSNSQINETIEKLEQQRNELNKIKSESKTSGQALTKEEEQKQKEIQETTEKLEQQKQEYSKQIELANQAFKERGIKAELMTGGGKVSRGYNNRVLGGLEDNAIVEFEQKLNALRETSNITESELMQLSEKWVKCGQDVAKFTAALNDNEKALLAEKGLIQNMAQPTYDASKGLMALSSILMEITMAFNALGNIDDIWSNEELSTGQKILETLTAISMVLPLIITLTNKENILKLAGLPISAARALGYVEEAAASEAAAAGTLTFAGALRVLGGSIATLLPVLIPVLVAFGAIAAVIALQYKNVHKARDAYEEYKKSSEDLSARNREIISQTEELSSALDSLKSKSESIKNLSKGTAEWSKAMSDLNNSTLDSIDKFNSLNDTLVLSGRSLSDLGTYGLEDLRLGEDFTYDVNGEIRLSEEAEIKMAEIQTAVINQANISEAQDNLEEARLKMQAENEELLNGILGRGQLFEHSDEYVKAMGEDVVKNSLNSPWMKSYVSGMSNQGLQNYGVDTLQEQTVQIIQDAIYNGKLTQDQLSNKSTITELLQTYSNMSDEEIASQRDFIITHVDELTHALYDNTEGLKSATEAYKAQLTNDYLTNTTNPFYEDLQNIDEKYRSGAAEYLADNQIFYENQFADSWDSQKQTIKDKYIQQYADKMGYSGTVKSGYKDENDEKVDEKELESQAKNLFAINSAQEILNKHKEEYLNFLEKEVEDSIEDDKALENIQKEYKKYSDTLDDIVDNNKKWSDLTEEQKKDVQDFSKAVKKDLVQALDVVDDATTDSILDPEFMADNAALIKEALDGDVEALDNLHDKIQSARIVEGVKLGIDLAPEAEQDLERAISAIQSKLDDLKPGIKIDVDEGGYRKSLNDMLETLKTTAVEAESASSKMTGSAASAQAAIAALVEAGVEGVTTDDLEWVEAQSPEYHSESKDEYEGIDPTITQEPFTAEGVQYDVSTADGATGTSNIVPHKVTSISGEVPHIEFNKTGKQSTKKTTDEKSKKIGYWRLKKGSNATIGKKNFKLPGATNTKAPSGGGPKGGSGGGGRRGSRRARVERARRGYEKSTVLERYKEITDKLDQNAKVSDRLAKVQDKLYGKSRLNAMDQVNKKHLDEISLLKTKAKEADNYYKKDKAEMEKRLKEALSIVKNGAGFSSKYLTSDTMNAIKNITGFTYGDFGNITNYTQIMSALQDELNELENMYNNFKGTKENQDKFKEEKITPVTEAISRLQEAIDQYDETRELIEELKDQIEDAYAQWQDTNYEKLTYSLELQITVNDNELKYIENKLNAISDNIYKAAESLDYYFSTTGENKLNNATKAISDYTTHVAELTEAYQNNTITQAKYIEGLQNSYDALLSNVNTLQDLKKEMMDYYGNTLNSVIEQLDKTNDRLSASSSLISHLQNILDLTGQNTNYDLIENLQGAQAAIDTTALNTAKAIYDMATSENDKKQKAYLEARAKSIEMMAAGGPEELRQQEIEALQKIIDTGGSSDEIAKASERLKVLQAMTDEAYKDLIEDNEEMARKEAEAAVEAFESARDAMFSSTEEALQHAADALETALNRAADAMEKALARMVGGFDELLRRMNLTSTRQDEYLTKTNQSYELNKMQRTLAKDMDATDNKNSKIKLANFAKELQALAERDELSNLELEIAQKKYELLKAQIALEDSRNAKNTIRLSRDNEGNYGYVYVANEEEVDDAQQAVEDAKNDLYNLQLEATNNYGQKYIQATQEYQNALKEFYASDEYKQLLGTGNQSAIDERIAAIQAQYAALTNSYKYLYETGYGATDYLVDALKNDAWVYSGYNDYVTNISQNLGGATNGFISDMTGAGSVFSTWLSNIKKYSNFDEQIDGIVGKTEQSMNTLADDFEITGEKLTIVLDQVSDKLQSFIEDTLPSLDKSIVDTTGVINQLKEILKDAVEGKIDQPTANFNKLMQIVAGSNAGNLQYDPTTHVAYTSGGTYGVTAKQAAAWSLDTIARNEVISEQLINAVESGKKGFFGFDKNGNMAYIIGATASDSEYKNWLSSNGILKAVKFDTGGYTGEWTGVNSGRLAFLDEKEIVLNEQDTNNILKAVSAVRDIATSGFLSALTPATIGIDRMKAQMIDQNVKIEAQFPNVSDRYEIEEAFNNLVNRASQHAYTNHK